MLALDKDGELDEGEPLVGAAGEVELVAVNVSVQHLPLAILLVLVHVDRLVLDGEKAHKKIISDMIIRLMYMSV